MKFSELGLAEPFLRATESLGYEIATPIQAEAIPVVLSGCDLIGCAQTGTGKTAAFTLPMLDRLMQTLPPKSAEEKVHAQSQQHPSGGKGKHQRRGKGARPKPRPIRALILSPTRELTAQIHESLERYGKYTPLRQTVVYGGVSQFHQVKALRHGVDALVATPGRLLDLMNQGHIDLSKVEILVFDEADQMLDMGFLPDLKRIVASVPKDRQTLMFSATMPQAIRRLAEQWLTAPTAIEVAPVSTPAERITQTVHLVDKKRKPDFLTQFLKETPRGRTLVFSRTKHGADKIVKRLKKEGMLAAAIHGDKTQGARTRALAQFKSKKHPVLVATDIAARGLDIDEVSHVVNFDLPETPEVYVHRIGRTARAGAEGEAVSFCAGDERGLLRNIERLTKLKIRVAPTVEGYETTDPISDAPKRGGNRGRRPSGGGNSRGGKIGGYAGSKHSGNKNSGNKTKPGAKRKFTSKYRSNDGDSGSSSKSEKPRRRKGSTEPTNKPKNSKPKNAKPQNSKAQNGQAQGHQAKSSGNGGATATASKPAGKPSGVSRPSVGGAANSPRRRRRRKHTPK